MPLVGGIVMFLLLLLLLLPLPAWMITHLGMLRLIGISVR